MMPKILIMDEPFDALDPKSKIEMIHLLNHLNQKHQMTLITTTHDINVVPEIADRIYVIHDGKIITCGPPQEVFSQIEALIMAHLQPPILTELFMRLKKRGFDLPMPSNLAEAEAILAGVMQQHKNKLRESI